MKQSIESRLDARIVEEIYKAAEDLGADPAAIRAMPLAKMYSALKQLGASPHLLSLVGSWGGSVPGYWTEDDDAATLALLRDWNAETETLAFNRQRTATAH